jgi:YD repeat-containing protein
MKSNRATQGFALAQPRAFLNAKRDYVSHLKSPDLMRMALLSASFLVLFSAPNISFAEPNGVWPFIKWKSLGQKLMSPPSGGSDLFKTPEEAFADILKASEVTNAGSGDVGTPVNLRPCVTTDSFFLGKKMNGINFYYCYDKHWKDKTTTGPHADIEIALECPTQKYTWLYQENLNNNDLLAICAVPQGVNPPTTDSAPGMCPTKPPVFAETGVKYQRELDYQDAAGLLNVERIWRSDLKRFVFPGASAVLDFSAYQATRTCHAGTADNGNGGDKTPYCFPYARTPLTDPVVEVADARGSWNRYNATTLASAPDVNEPLTAVKDAAGKITSWRVRKPNQVLETYDAATGQLTRRDFADGRFITYGYLIAASLSAPPIGLLMEMKDQNARSVQFTYNTAFRLTSVTLPDGQLIRYAYNEPSANCPINSTDMTPIAGCERLTSVTYPDGSVRRYHYNEATHLDASLSPLVSYLTGITDERGVRLSNYRYDAAGRAVSSGWGGFNDQFSYGATQTDITDPLGSTRTVGYQSLFGKRRPISQSQPAGSGCAASTSAQSWDANANPASRDDFNGSRTCYTHDLSRNLETTRVEGLANTASCSGVTPANVVLPSGSRKTSTQWHPDWRLPSKVAEAGRITTQVYNGQPDPFNGNAIASCAPATALLPDGKPIAVLCKQVEQATTDVNGSLSFTAALQSGVAARITQWLYNAQGQVLREDGPRSDVSDVSTYSYYANTTADHRVGDLKDMTDASGQITQFTRYNAHGQLLQSVDANGVLSTFTYDLRQRPTSQTVGAQTTSYTYDAAGQLTLITQADGSTVRYSYDTAQRLVAVADHRGNRIDYTLDANGNRTAENAKDPGGLLKRQLARNIDALSRLQKATGRE